MIYIFSNKGDNILENEQEIQSKDERDIYRNINDVVIALKKAQKENINVNLLIGAGCSVTAGIPAANGMVNLIKEEFPREYDRSKVKNYPNCMSKLTPSERKNLIAQIVENAKVNWTHVAIAQLLKAGFINRILTPNFDNLVQRSCSLVGEFPAIYDLATSSLFRTDLLFDKSVIHLHGQHTGFILCNTEKEVESQSEILKPIFEQLDQKSLWIIIGYSGNNDPIFRLLAKKELFEHRLFWIGYENNEPSEMLKKELLSEEKYAFYVNGYNSDDFFVKVSQELGCFPPTFIQKPFTYLSDTLDTLAKYKVPSPFNAILKEKYDVDNFNDLRLITKNVVEEAISTIEKDKTLMAQHYLMAGLFDEVIQLSIEEGGEQLDLDLELDVEFEYQVINALRSRQQDNDLINALERLEKLNSNFSDDYSINYDLADLTFIIFARELTPSSLNDNFDCFTLSMNYFENACKLTETKKCMLAWDTRLFIAFQFLSKRFDNSEKEEKLREAVNKFLIYLNSFETTSTVSDMIRISTIPYILIEKGDFSFAKFILEQTQNLAFISNITKSYIMANWGFWFFRNNDIDFDIAQKNGVLYYKHSLELLLDSPNIDSPDDELYIAFKQKYLLEHAQFLLNRTSDVGTAISLLTECIELGEVSNSHRTIHQTAVEVLNSLQPQNTPALQAAATNKID